MQRANGLFHISARSANSFLQAPARTNPLGSPEKIRQTRPSLEWNYRHKMVVIFAICGWKHFPSPSRRNCMAVRRFNLGFGPIKEALELLLSTSILHMQPRNGNRALLRAFCYYRRKECLRCTIYLSRQVINILRRSPTIFKENPKSRK